MSYAFATEAFRDAAPVAAAAFTIRVEAMADVARREALLDRVMGEARFVKTSARLRAGRVPAIALVAEIDGAIVGTVRLWNVAAEGRKLLMLGPLAVDADRQGLGISAALLRAAIEAARALGLAAIVLVGDLPYYGRFGFAAGLTLGLAMPGPVDRARFLGLDLVEGTLMGASGTLRATGRRQPLAIAPRKAA